jgi:peptidoglycan/LPS O-acetylase OafA/YrhL
MARQDDPAPAAPRREFDIDAFRGVVCLSLVLLHFYTHGPLQQRLYALFGPVGDFIVMHFRLGVESFFVLAGFMMAHMLRPTPGERVSSPGYLKRRFFRLILPYWTAVLLATADRWGMWLVFKRAGAEVPGAYDVLSQLLLVQEFVGRPDAAVGYWSLVSLEQFYLLWLGAYAVCRFIFGAGGEGYGRAETAMSWLTLAACLGSAALLMSEQHTQFRLPRYAVYLSLGLMMYWAVRQGFARPQFIIGVLALAAVAVVTDKSRPIAGLLSVAILVPLARGLRLPGWSPLTWLAWVGRRSYSIYLIHPIVGLRVLSLSRMVPSEAPWVAPALIGLALVASLLAAEVFYRLVELPCQARARKVVYRRRGSPPAPPAVNPEVTATHPSAASPV